MGIKNLNKVIKEYANSSVKKIEFAKLNGKRIAIDTSIFMYKFSYFTPNFIKLFWFQIKRCIENNIIPVYVFDGSPPDEKGDTINDRKQKKEELNNKLDTLKNDVVNLNKELDNIENSNIPEENKKKKKLEIENKLIDTTSEIKAKEKINVKITTKKIKHLKKFFKQMNIPFIEADGEAELLASYLCKSQIVDGVVSDDTDLLPLGTPVIYKDYTINNNNITEIILDDVLKEINFTQEQFIDYCILCGCDYSGTLPKIGIKTALTLIKEFNNIETILEKRNIDINQLNNFKYKEARKLFTQIPDNPKTLKKINKLDEEIKNININFLPENELKEWIDNFPMN